LTGIVDDEIRFTKVGKLLGRRSDQHVVLSISGAPNTYSGSGLTMKRAWYAREAMTRTLILYFGSQPAKPSKT
jgi:hypothetical protein